MPFFEAVYEVVRGIPPGKVATYGQVARLCGNPRAARQVGWALHANPQPGQGSGAVPCHRVVNREGRCSAAFAFGGAEVQRGLLEQEGVAFLEDGAADLEQFLWEA